MAIPNDLIEMLVWLHQITLVVQFVLFLHCAAIFDWYVDEQHFNRILINILFKVAPVLNYFNFTSIQKKFLEWNLLYERFFFFQTIIYFLFLKEKFLPFIVSQAWNDINQWLLSLPIILLRSHRLHAAFVHVADQL